jgi:hypothetical protein
LQGRLQPVYRPGPAEAGTPTGVWRADHVGE